MIADDLEFKEGLAILIRLRSAVLQSVEANFEFLVKETSWGLLHAMYERALDHVNSCFLLFSEGMHSSAEALCRSAIEAAINVQFFSLTETEETLIQYFQDYIATERAQNRKWLCSLNNATYAAEVKTVHLNAIANKETALTAYEQFASRAFDQIGHDFTKKARPWPSVFDRYSILGKEVAYRTVYASLCSQTHNDAEDLLNKFIAGTSHTAGMMERLQRENLSFSLLMVINALSTLIEAAAFYLAKYPFGAESNAILLPSLGDALALAERVAKRPELM